MSRPHRARGAALVVLLAVLAAVAAIGAAVSIRLSVDLEGRRAEDRRLQALWLARSAVDLGKPGKVEVALGSDLARVTTTVAPAPGGKKVTSTVFFERYGTARVEAVLGRAGAAVDWQERYERSDVP